MMQYFLGPDNSPGMQSKGIRQFLQKRVVSPGGNTFYTQASDALSMSEVSSSTVDMLLERVPSAFAAFSTVKLSGSYAGPCLRIRRSSDNAESDIGFSGNNLDTAAISSFCGLGSGFVTKWFDQSGNARDLSQSTTTVQPIIYESGVLCQTNSRPCVKFSAASVQRLTNGVAGDWNFLHDGTPWTWVGISQVNDSASAKALWATHSSANPRGAAVVRTGTEALQVQMGNGSAPVINVTASAPSTAQQITTIITDPANGTAASRVNVWANGSALTANNSASATPAAGNSSVFSVGTRTATLYPFVGTMQSLIWWPSGQTANRTTFESALNALYGVF